MIFADFHIHSRFARGTSKNITLDNLERFARVKGLNLLGTGDFTHPKWFAELKSNLTEDGFGILKSKTGFKFVLQTEISLIYKQGGRVRKVHLLVLAPSFDIVSQISDELLKFGRLDYDGRPIFGMPAYEFVEIMHSISPDIEVIPAHIWTPWFSLFGSHSGFDSIKDCFQDKTKYIHALETGLSSDPQMNWTISALDKFTLVSNSDAHSMFPFRLGRECNVFNFKQDFTYKDVLNAIRFKKNFVMTLEVNPSFGKYYFDGHRSCKFSADPRKHISVCPVCGKELTFGVLHRVLELADRPFGYKPKDALPFKHLLPLQELIATFLGVGIQTKKVNIIYDKLISVFGSEFNVLLDADAQALSKVVGKSLADLIILNREDKLNIIPGYDGVYGKIKL